MHMLSRNSDSDGTSACHGPVGRAGTGRADMKIARWRAVELRKYDGPGQRAAFKMWLHVGRSAQPIRRPTCFHGPVGVVAHNIWCTAVLLYTALLLQYYFKVVRPAHEDSYKL